MDNSNISVRNQVTFYCPDCKISFKKKPDLIEEYPERDYHPYFYYGNCPQCKEQCEQAYWDQNLLKAHAHATGPKTVAGKAASAANLEGHPTPEETLITRFNAMKHGLHAKVADYFPARPGKYPQCDGCELRESICSQEVACLKRVELFMKHHIAFDTKDPSMLMGLRADTQAAIQGLINDMILTIAQDGGPRVEDPVWTYVKDEGFQLVSYYDAGLGRMVRVTEKKAHPLLKPLIDFINKNSMTLADMEMTPKVQDEQEAMKGFLDAAKPNANESLEDFSQKTLGVMDDMKALIKKSQEATNNDPILIEHEQSEGNG